MRSKRMKPIAQHADQIEQQAVQIFVAAQQAIIDAQQQLEQLLEYRIEYNNRRINGAFCASQHKDYQVFLEKLNQSIEQARQTIILRQQQCEQQKLQWLKRRARSKALDAVIAKYQQQEVKMQARIEQKEQDEFAARIGQQKIQQKN